MYKNGGYQLLDLNGNITKCDGAYKTLKNSHGKQIIVSGLNINGVITNAVNAVCKLINSIYWLTVVLPLEGYYKIYIIAIQEDDSISITEGASLPRVTVEDEGKGLKIEDGQPVWTFFNELPRYSSEENDKVLRVVEGVPTWVLFDALPEWDGQEDAGKVLKINAEWNPVTEQLEYNVVWDNLSYNVNMFFLDEDGHLTYSMNPEDSVTVLPKFIVNGLLLTIDPTEYTVEIAIDEEGTSDPTHFTLEDGTLTATADAITGDFCMLTMTVTQYGEFLASGATQIRVGGNIEGGQE